MHTCETCGVSTYDPDAHCNTCAETTYGTDYDSLTFESWPEPDDCSCGETCSCGDTDYETDLESREEPRGCETCGY